MRADPSPPGPRIELSGSCQACRPKLGNRDPVGASGRITGMAAPAMTPQYPGSLRVLSAGAVDAGGTQGRPAVHLTEIHEHGFSGSAVLIRQRLARWRVWPAHTDG